MKRGSSFPGPLPQRNPRLGLTLIELVVVMVILAAIAGILLPLLPNLVTRAHTSTSATNISEVAKAVQTYQATYLSYPNNLDSIVTGTGGVASYVPGATTGDFAVVNATADHIEALNEVGVTNVAQMVESAGGDWNPTFYPYGSNSALSPKSAPISTTLAANAPLASLSLAAKQRLGLNTDDTLYVVLGVGGYTSMQGKTLQEAPVHFGDKQNESPNKAYSRYGVVFQLTNNTQVLPKAQLTQVVAFHDNGLVGLNQHLAEYHQAAQ